MRHGKRFGRGRQPPYGDLGDGRSALQPTPPNGARIRTRGLPIQTSWPRTRQPYPGQSDFPPASRASRPLGDSRSGLKSGRTRGRISPEIPPSGYAGVPGCQGSCTLREPEQPSPPPPGAGRPSSLQLAPWAPESVFLGDRRRSPRKLTRAPHARRSEPRTKAPAILRPIGPPKDSRVWKAANREKIETRKADAGSLERSDPTCLTARHDCLSPRTARL